MEKSWIDSEDGRNALEDLASHPEVINIISSIGSKQIQAMNQALLGVNLMDPKSDRTMLLTKAEIDGALKMLKYIKELLEHPRRK